MKRKERKERVQTKIKNNEKQKEKGGFIKVR